MQTYGRIDSGLRSKKATTVLETPTFGVGSPLPTWVHQTCKTYPWIQRGLAPDAQWPWQKKGILVCLVELIRGTLPKKRTEGRNPLGNRVAPNQMRTGRTHVSWALRPRGSFSTRVSRISRQVPGSRNMDCVATVLVGGSEAMVPGRPTKATRLTKNNRVFWSSPKGISGKEDIQWFLKGNKYTSILARLF